jgi:hypothetical protein
MTITKRNSLLADAKELHRSIEEKTLKNKKENAVLKISHFLK